MINVDPSFPFVAFSGKAGRKSYYDRTANIIKPDGIFP